MNAAPDQAGQSPAGITAVISTHDRCGELRTTLTALTELGLSRLRIMVVDNASSDDTRTMLRHEFPGVLLIPHSDNEPIVGYNLAFDEVNTPYVFVMDDDSAPRPGVLEAMADCLDGYPVIGATAGNILGPDSESEWGEAGQVECSSSWDNLIGCGFMVRKTVLNQVDGYNPQFGLYYNDLELALRILAFGHRIVFQSSWVVEHRRLSGPSMTERKIARMVRNFSFAVRSHFGGFRKLNLLLGHGLLVLKLAIRHGGLPHFPKWLWEGVTAQTGRLYVPVPPSLALDHFLDQYSLSSLLKRFPIKWSAQASEYAATPLERLSGIPRPEVRLSATIARSMRVRSKQAEKAFRAIGPVCYWQSRLSNGDYTALHDDETAEARRNQDAATHCDCANILSWYQSPWKDYQQHLMLFSYLSCRDRLIGRTSVPYWHYRPVISIVTPVHRVDLAHLEECLLSVERQVYPHWELCLVEDGSGMPEVRARLEAFAARHGTKVKLVCRDENWGITRTSQQALEMATGEFVALLDHDDRLAPEALFEVVRQLNLNPSYDWIYSDNDKISPEGERFNYHFKPDWSPDLLTSYNYVLHLSVMRRDLMLECGGFRDGFEGSQDYDLYLRLAEKTTRILHIPRILYSWRESEQSIAADVSHKNYVYTAGVRALGKALERRNEEGTATHGTGSWAGNYRVTRRLNHGETTLIVIGEGRKELTGTAWTENSASIAFRQIIELDEEESCSALREAFTSCRTECALVVQVGTKPVSDDAVPELLGSLVPQGAAIVAPKILTPDNRTDHCGLVVAPGGRILFPLRGLEGDAPGYGAYGAVVRNVSCVSPLVVGVDCAALREVADFPPRLSVFGAILDACFALRLAGHRVIADGGVCVRYDRGPLELPASVCPGGADFLYIVRRRPCLTVAGDPFYNRHLREHPTDFGVRYDTDQSYSM